MASERRCRVGQAASAAACGTSVPPARRQEEVGKVYLQTAVDCHSRCAWCSLYPNKMLVTGVRLMNNDVLPTFEVQGVRIATVLSENRWECCGRHDRKSYELLLQLEEIENRTKRVRRRQSTDVIDKVFIGRLYTVVPNSRNLAHRYPLDHA